jgi:hypothetical protein
LHGLQITIPSSSEAAKPAVRSEIEPSWKRTKGRLQTVAHLTGYRWFESISLQQSLANEPFLIGAALLAVYLVLGVLYESYACSRL